MSNTREAIDKVKDKLSEVGSQINENTAEFRNFISKWIWPIIITIISVGYLIYYIKNIYRREDKLIKPLKEYSRRGQIEAITTKKEIMEGNFKLCDFYIASSYRTFLPGYQTNDLASIKCIGHVIECGARYVELDIYQDQFCWDSKPMVYSGKLEGLWNYTNKLDFEECIKKIRETAFGSAYVVNGNDPFFLCLNIYTESNYKLLNKIAEILSDNLGKKMLNSSYSYKKNNLAQTPIKELIGKVVIISNNTWEGSPMEEFVNFSWEMPFLRNLTHEQVDDNFDKEELKEYNKRNLTRVFPKLRTTESKNFNPAQSWLTGCQFVCMNYQNMDQFMSFYLDKFSSQSLVLKPEPLRYKPPTYAEPTKQDPVVSFAPLQHSTPFYSITY